DAVNDTSGTSRLPSAGTPGPVCQIGFAYSLLAPPPLAPMGNPPPGGSFHDVSGMYDSAEACVAVFVALQKVPAPSASSVPPIAVTPGTDAGTCSAIPLTATFTS